MKSQLIRINWGSWGTVRDAEREGDKDVDKLRKDQDPSGPLGSAEMLGRTSQLSS